MSELNLVRGPQRNDPRRNADAVLARARSRDHRVVTLESAGSPADSAVTVVLPRYRVTAADPDAADPDTTQNFRVQAPGRERS
ncbi:MAG: hypothetical protein ABI251_01035 [Mycobacteriaceae bacterium]